MRNDELGMSNQEWKISAQHLLEDNILPFWTDRMVDYENGGFYGRIDGNGNLHKDAEKGAILNARILWTFSAAYRVLRKQEYLDIATRAKEYILAHFIDPEYGGVYWSLDSFGRPLDTKKQTYAIGFTIYGMSEYARATGDKEALECAIRLYNDIETYAFDGKNIGYIEALTRDWQPIADMRLSDKDENGSRTMNTHLHILEPYTNLYRVWKDPHLKEQLQTLIHIFTDKLYNPVTHHLDLFFDDSWQGRHDIESYGHDIEAAWLLNEALEELGIQNSEFRIQNLEIIRNIAIASKDGLQPDGSMIHESRAESREPIADLHQPRLADDTDSSRQWWVQCETVIGFIDQWQHGGEDADLDIAQKAYQYILDRLIDWDNGEWYWAVLPDGTTDRENDKAGFWKCPYHNSRMCLEIIERIGNSREI